jgi:hypothetical protein
MSQRYRCDHLVGCLPGESAVRQTDRRKERTQTASVVPLGKLHSARVHPGRQQAPTLSAYERGLR